MFLVIIMHHCKPDMIPQAIARIDGNGDLMAAVPGFLFRHRTTAKADPLTIGTVTGWVEEAAYGAWLKVKADLPDFGIPPYLSATSEKHDVIKSHEPV